MGIQEEDILAFELQLIVSEALGKHFQCEHKEDENRKVYALAQVGIAWKMTEYFTESEDVDEADFIEASEDSLALQYSELEKARAEDDRKLRIVSLARIRLITAFLRRLADTKRRSLLLSGEFEPRPL